MRPRAWGSIGQWSASRSTASASPAASRSAGRSSSRTRRSRSRTTRSPHGSVAAEIARFDTRGRRSAARARRPARRDDASDAPGEFGAFLDVHWMILNDPTLAEVPKRIIAEQRCNAEWALTQQMNVLVEQFEEIEDPYLRERKADVVQVVERVLKRLMGKPGALPPPRPRSRRSSSRTTFRRRTSSSSSTHRYAAFLTDLGGVTSHTAIVARSLERAGRGRDAQRARADPRRRDADRRRHQQRRHRQPGPRGARRVPAEAERARARARRSSSACRRSRRTRSTALRIELHANIELPDDLAQALETGAIGRRPVPLGVPVPEPRRAAVGGRAVRGLPARSPRAWTASRSPSARSISAPTSRRKASTASSRVAPNPALGLRAVRFCLAEPRLFLTQLRAILRASHYGNVQILIPMLASVGEIDQTLAMIAQAKESLREQGLPFDPRHQGRRHDRDSRGGARDRRVPRRSSTSCRSAPTT